MNKHINRKHILSKYNIDTFISEKYHQDACDIIALGAYHKNYFLGKLRTVTRDYKKTVVIKELF